MRKYGRYVCMYNVNMFVIGFSTGDVKALSSEKSPLIMKDVKWYTHNCTVGYLVSGKNDCMTKCSDIKNFFINIFYNIVIYI